MIEKRFDFEDEYITLDGGVFAIAKNRQDAELISRTLNQLYNENEELKQGIIDCLFKGESLQIFAEKMGLIE